MQTPLLGLHHVTAIVDDPQENIDFYTLVLGLRLIKQTVNFDDPYTYHFYFGDETGRPGTIVTFFPWPNGRRGSRGVGQISAFAFAVPAGSLPYWQEHLTFHEIPFSEPEIRFGASTLSFYDPAGLLIELVEQPELDRGVSNRYSDVPASAAIQGLFGVTLTVSQAAASATFLTEQMGFRTLADVSGQLRYAIGEGRDTAVVDLIERPGVPRGQIAAGSVHHVAWRLPDAVAQQWWRDHLAREGRDVTPVRDRQYFQSVYFREPGGVLFEIATDVPGFTVDESINELGTHLQLPLWLAPQRSAIAQRLPPIVLPGMSAPAQPTSEKELTVSTITTSFIHRFAPAQCADAPTLLLLHGTGGNENDLLALGRALYPQAALLSPRGQVRENGMPRFFRRLAEGVFDLDDLRQRTADLAAFVSEAGELYHFDPKRVIAVGYSNGANIAASLMLLYPQVLAGAVLFHAMVPFVPDQLPDLQGIPVFMGAGRTDAMIPPAQTEQLARMLQQSGATVDVHWEQGGHALNQAEVQAAIAWLERQPIR